MIIGLYVKNMNAKKRVIMVLLVMICFIAGSFIFENQVHALVNTVETATASEKRIAYDHWGFGGIMVINSEGKVAIYKNGQLIEVNYPEAAPPAELNNVVEVTSHESAYVALKRDGTLTQWGAPYNCVIPDGVDNVVAISGACSHVLAVKGDGTVVGWGHSYMGVLDIPDGLNNVVDIETTWDYVVALKRDGTIVQWRYTRLPEGLTDVAAVSINSINAMALKRDGTVVCDDDPPAGLNDVVAISEGGDRNYLALKRDGTVVQWKYEFSHYEHTGGGLVGIYELQILSPPLGLSDVVAIDANYNSYLALKSDGTVVEWGEETHLPPGLNLSPALDSLYVNDALLAGFNPDTLEYTLPSVANGITEIRVAPILEDMDHTYLTVNGEAKDSGATTTVPLNLGDNVIEIKVGFNNENIARTYTLHIHRDLPSATNADLENLTVNTGILTPAFDSDTENYSVSVDNDISSIDITLTPADSGASASINGLGEGTGPQTLTVPLDEGDNNVEIFIRASDNTTTKTYSLLVSRGPSSNANLVNLCIDAGNLNPAFKEDTVTYQVSTDSNDTRTGSAITATLADPNATLTIGGNPAISNMKATVELEHGKNLIPIVVTAKDGITQKAYIISVNGTVDNADLSSLIVSEGNLSFHKDTTEYYIDVANDTETIDISAAPSGPEALVLIEGGVRTSSAIDLEVGENTIDVMVVAQDASTKTYTITVSRKEALTINNESLPIGIIGGTYQAALTAEGGTLPYTWTAAGLPAGLTLATTGTITGTPENEGNYNVEVTVKDDDGLEVIKILTLKVNLGCGNGTYIIQPSQDITYTGGYTEDGIPIMTVNEGISGFKYFSVSVEPVTGHSGNEVCVFIHMRGGKQLGISFIKADTEIINSVGAAFNVKAGDVIKAYIVDDLTNDPDTNPNVL